MDQQLEPLTASLWFARLEMIASGRLNSLENALRHASHLLKLTPFQFREAVGAGLSEERFEALLEAGDLDTAARHLIAQPTALQVDESDGVGRVVASISCAITGRVINGTGPCATSAVLNAWATCLLALKTRGDHEPNQGFQPGHAPVMCARNTLH